MVKFVTLTEKEMKEISNLKDKIKYADMSKDIFLEWLIKNSGNIFSFVNKENGNINAFMILQIVKKNLKNQLFVHSIYVPPHSNGLSKEFYDNMMEFGKYLGLKKVRMRTLRKPDGFIRRWGFELDSYNLTKEIQ